MELYHLAKVTDLKRQTLGVDLAEFQEHAPDLIRGQSLLVGVRGEASVFPLRAIAPAASADV